MENQVQQIVLSDQEELRKRKINEFEFGQLPDGSQIGEYQNYDYAYKKFSMNSLAGLWNVDLIYSGKFVNSLFILRNNKGYLFDSNVSYKDSLITNYSKKIMGLNQDWFNERQNNIYRLVLSQDIQKILNKK